MENIVICVDRRWLLGGSLVAAACLMEEISQPWFLSRSFARSDLLPDTLGIVFFGWLARQVRRSRAQV